MIGLLKVIFFLRRNKLYTTNVLLGLGNKKAENKKRAATERVTQNTHCISGFIVVNGRERRVTIRDDRDEQRIQTRNNHGISLASRSNNSRREVNDRSGNTTRCICASGSVREIGEINTRDLVS